jgi:hypothetical protein
MTHHMLLRRPLLSSVFEPIGNGPRSLPIHPADCQCMKRPETATPAWQPDPAPARRTRIWEIHASVHCSIIGTCLSTAELRRVVIRAGVAGADRADEHELHAMGVTLAGNARPGGKLLQKALDQRYRAAINQLAPLSTSEALLAAWVAAQRRGDIPGAFWAVLTHPAATDAVTKKAFSDVHMLSHLVGAANRADIRRLRELEEDNAALLAKLERQQRHIRDGFISRDATIRRLTGLLARGADRTDTPSADDGQDAVADLTRRLGREAAARERLERRIAALTQAVDDGEEGRRRVERERDSLQQALDAIEARLGADLDREEADRLDLDGMHLLYVGGRAHQIPRLRTLVERSGGRFLHHDAGLEHNATLLPGLVSRADIVVFPVDCISHDAAGAIKRSCGQLHKRYVPLRTSSLTCLMSALAARQPVSAQ